MTLRRPLSRLIHSRFQWTATVEKATPLQALYLRRSIGRQVIEICSKFRRMSTLAFSDTKFNSDNYSAYRPTYGKSLLDQLLSNHKGRTQVAIDLGCGTGQITTTIAGHFTKVYGFDTSAKMLESASLRLNIDYKVGKAEALSLEDESIDLVTVGQAAHWFDSDLWFKEIARILRPNGTLAFWSYNEAEFTDSTEASRIWNFYSHDANRLGPHWP